MTSLANPKTDVEISTPNAFAVFMFTTIRTIAARQSALLMDDMRPPSHRALAVGITLSMRQCL
jgi:hypothetical protein